MTATFYYSDTLTQWRIAAQCLDKLTEAAIETRDELIAKKESQMKNIQLLAGVLNGLPKSDISPEA